MYRFLALGLLWAPLALARPGVVAGVNPVDAAKAIVINGANANKAVTCEEGQAVTINGSKLEVKLTGACGEVSVAGSHNVIAAEGLAAVVLNGSHNTLTYKQNLSGREALPVHKAGVENHITKEG